jgi:hypothetical protein
VTSILFFDPLLPWPVLVALLLVTLIGTGLALRRGLSGWGLRGLAGLVIMLALAGPVLHREDREVLSDIVILVVDQSASQKLDQRANQTETAAKNLEAKINALGNMEMRRVDLPDGPGDSGTLAMTALAEALAEEPRSRIAGAFLISDGRVHDIENAPDMPAPFHLLLTGSETDWDRRLIVENAPSYAILDESITLSIRVEDQGNAPSGETTTSLEIAIDGEEPMMFQVPIGQDIKVPVTLPHGGRNILQFSVPLADGELTGGNNSVLLQINGVRDRLRVLLVSGEPHPGGRTWRNLLKSDSSVDLVHFTILRPPEKQDGVPVGELSLIAFPTRELFLEKIDDFDLIIFDRYKRRGILPSIYLENVRNYVEKGGAILVAAGPDFASADSIFRSPLSAVLPASPSARVIEQGYLPLVTDIGQRHPVTAGLHPPANQDHWGRWLRQIEVTTKSGDVVMSGFEGEPLLVLDRVGEGRVALLASDHAWLWSRGFEGGGPQLELLRRLAHWMMKEPELEEEALWAEQQGKALKVFRRTLKDDPGPLTVTTPSGKKIETKLENSAPGLFEAVIPTDEPGLFRLADNFESSVVGLGPAAPRELVETIASDSVLSPTINMSRGGIATLSEGMPALRTVRPARPASGRGWVGVTPRGAYQTKGIVQIPLMPAWLTLVLVGFMIVGAWLREGRR